MARLCLENSLNLVLMDFFPFLGSSLAVFFINSLGCLPRVELIIGYANEFRVKIYKNISVSAHLQVVELGRWLARLAPLFSLRWRRRRRRKRKRKSLDALDLWWFTVYRRRRRSQLLISRRTHNTIEAPAPATHIGFIHIHRLNDVASRRFIANRPGSPKKRRKKPFWFGRFSCFCCCWPFPFSLASFDGLCILVSFSAQAHRGRQATVFFIIFRLFI